MLLKRLILSKDFSFGQIASGSHSPRGPMFPGSIEAWAIRDGKIVEIMFFECSFGYTKLPELVG